MIDLVLGSWFYSQELPMRFYSIFLVEYCTANQKVMLSIQALENPSIFIGLPHYAMLPRYLVKSICVFVIFEFKSPLSMSTQGMLSKVSSNMR